MLNAKRFVVTALFTFVLLMVVFAPLSGQESAYDPWLDYNDDGIIDVNDLAAMSHAYGSTGEPLNLPMALAFDSGWVEISDKLGQAFNITHNLNRADTFIDVTGMWAADGPTHQKFINATMSPTGWEARLNGCMGVISMAQTTDGGCALTGQNWSSGPADFFLLKTDDRGVQQWNRTYGTAVHESAYSVVQTSDGGYALAGFMYGGVATEYDFWLVKTDAVGNMQWNRTYGGARGDYVRSLIQTMDGGYAIAGFTESFGATQFERDFYLVKTDLDGFMVWNRTYDLYGSGLTDEWARAVIQTADGGYALAGYTRDESYPDAWLVKTDEGGNVIWNKTYGGSGWDEAFSVIQTFDGGYALAGDFRTDPFSHGGFGLVRTDAVGGMAWNKTYGDLEGEASSVVQTVDGGYALAGIALEELTYISRFVRTDSYGNELFSRVYPWEFQSMVKTDDGGYLMMRKDMNDEDVVLSKMNDWGFASFPQVGLTTVKSTLNVLTLYRGEDDPYWNYVRVRIWVLKETP